MAAKKIMPDCVFICAPHTHLYGKPEGDKARDRALSLSSPDTEAERQREGEGESTRRWFGGEWGKRRPTLSH